MMENLEINLFPAVSCALQFTSRPMGSSELYALPQFQAHAPNINRLTAYLNRLWREGHLLRVLPPSVLMAGSTWAYTWNDRIAKSRKELDKRSRVLADRRSALITENDGEIKVETPRLVISMPGKSHGFAYLEALKEGLSD